MELNMMELAGTKTGETKRNGAKPGQSKRDEAKAPPPVTFPLPPDVWRRYIIEGMTRDYGMTITDTTGRFQDDYLMMSGQAVVKK